MRNTAVIAAVLSLLLLAAFAWWFSPPWLWLLAYGGVAFLATLSVPILYRLSGFTQADEIEWLNKREEKEHVEMQAELVHVRRQLDELKVSEGVRQVDVLRRLLDDYHGVVETRFRGKAKSPLAYLSAARRAQQQVIHNLHDAIATRHSLSSISRHDARASFEEDYSSRIDSYQSRDEEYSSRFDDTDVDDDDTGAYHKRRKRSERHDSRKRDKPRESRRSNPVVKPPVIAQDAAPDERQLRLNSLEADQQQRLTSLLDDNQQLLDALTDTAVEVANIRRVSDYDRLDTLARLVSLAEIASHTGK